MSGVIVGKYQGKYLIFPGQQFVLVAAPTRSGKGVAIVIPNLLNYEDSVVVLDLKMENYRLTSLFRERNGQKVYLFAPFAEDGITHRWNMLDTVSRHRNTRIGDVLSVGQSLYPSDCDPKDKFWNDNARNLFLAFVLYLMESPELPCTFGEVFRQSSGRGRPIKEYCESIIKERADAGNPLSNECLDAFGRFLAAPENTLGNILSTFNAPLLIFANPMVDAATSASDFDINSVRKQRMSIYIGIQPSQLADASLLINMFFSQLINLNTKELPEDNPSLRYACLCVLDEFTSIGKVGIIAKANSFIAGYNVRLLTIVQSIAQLEGVYGEQDTRTLVTNHGLQIMYPPREQKDANDYSEMLGYFTEKSVSKGNSNSGGFGAGNMTRSENTSENRRALMLPQELKEMPQDEEFILMENTKPIRCHKARYFNDHVFIDRLKSVSPTLAALDHVGWRAYARKLGLNSIGKVLPTSSQLKEVAFIRREMSSAVPFLDVDLYKAKMEGRMRPLEEGEPIDPATLAIDVAALPTIDNQKDPAPKQVEALVDAFMSELEWGDEDAYEEPAPTPAVPVTEAAGGWIEKGDDAAAALPAMAGADNDET